MPDKFLRFTLPFTSFALAGWVIFYPKPYAACVFAGLMFPVIIFLASRLRPDRFSLTDSKRGYRNPKIDLAGPFGVVSAGLFLRAFIDFRFPDTASLLLWVGAVSLIVGLVLWVTINGASLSVALLIGAFYSLPAVAFVNATTQALPAKSLQALVVEKHRYTKPRLRTVVVLAEGQSHEIPVSEESFATIESGSRLCLIEHYGLLRLRSMALEHCAQ